MASIDMPQSTPDMSFNSDGDTDCSTSRRVSGIISMLESPVIKKEVDKTGDELSATQPVRILKDVVAYVEVRTGAENRSKAIISKLKQLGATVVDKLGDDVTHVIWKDGKKSTVDRAKKRSIPIVSVLWVDSCMQNETRVSENLFAVQNDKPKGTPIALPRLKKTKSMQPKDFDEDVASSAERGERIRKRKENKDKRRPKSPSKNSAYFVAETQPQSPFLGSPFSPNLAVPDTPVSLRERFNCIKRNMQELEDSQSDSPESPVVVKPGGSDELPLQRKLFGGSVSPMSTPPTSPQPLSTSTQRSPSKLSIKCETIEEEPSFNLSPSKDTSPTRRPLSPVTNTVHSPGRILESPPVQVISPNTRKRSKKTTHTAKSPTFSTLKTSPVSQRRSPRGAPSKTNDAGESSSDSDKKPVNRIIAKPRKKKLYSASAHPEIELTQPATTSSTKSNDETILGVPGIKARKGRSKNDNNVISELAGLPKQVKTSKRKHSKISDSESDSCNERKKSKSSSSSEEDSIPRKTRTSGRFLEMDDSVSEQTEQESKVRRKVSSKKTAKFTDLKDREPSARKVPVDILQQDFESEYEESTLYLNTQSNVSKVWATTNAVTQPSPASRRRSGKISAELGGETDSSSRVTGQGKSLTKGTQDEAKSVPASPNVRTTRRKSVATCSPAPVKEPVTTGERKSPPKAKGRRKSVAVCSPARTSLRETSDSTDAGQSLEQRKTRRRSAAVPGPVEQDDSVNMPETIGATNTGRRRKSIAVPSTVAEEAPIAKVNGKRSVTNRTTEVVDEPITVNNVEETPEIVKSKPRRRSGIQTPTFDTQPIDISNKTIRTPTVSPAAQTPVNRRRSMRMFAISNSMQKAGTPMNIRNEGNVSAVETARDKDTTVANEISVASTSNKCPADFDSTADESVLELAKRKKKKAHNSSQVSRTQQGSKITASSDSGFSHVDTSYLSSASVFSPAAKSRKSIDEFRPSTFNISTQKKLARNKSAKPSLSDIDSSEEESKVLTSRQSKKQKPKTTNGRKDKTSISDLASDVNATDTNTKFKSKSKTNRKSSRSSAESTASSASDGNDSKGTSRRKRASGSRSPKYPNSIVMTSLHYNEQDTIKGVVKQMGGFHILEKVDDTTTHIVCGGNRRTLNVLYAIAQGCWIVSQEWVFNSLEVGKWMDEEPFEVHGDFPACLIARQERASAHGTYKQDLFSQSGLIYVCEGTSPPTRHLNDLVELCSGQITRCLRKADIVLGGVKTGHTCLSEQWVLDSITAHKSLPVEPYRMGVDGRLVRSPSPDY